MATEKSTKMQRIMRDLPNKHANFHRCTGDVVRKVDTGNKAEAMHMLKNEFSSIAKETVTAIMALKREIE